MVLTNDFLIMCEAGPEAYNFLAAHALLGLEIDAAIAACTKNGFLELAEWLKEQKSKEVYVRLNGSIFSMHTFQVFNPLTGQHNQYETEAEARIALVTLAQEILNLHCPRVAQELRNENGDTTWVASALHKTLVVSCRGS